MKPWMMMKQGIRFNRLLEKRMILVVGSGLLAGALFHRQLVISGGVCQRNDHLILKCFDAFYGAFLFRGNGHKLNQASG